MFKTTKSRLVLAALALLVCVSMFVGSTFAWFTDSVSSVNNIIKSGNLDIEVQYSLDGTTWNDLAVDTPIFSADDLWEPGHTVVAALRIKNVGSLAAKLDVATDVVNELEGTNVYEESFKLSDYLEVYTGNDASAIDFTDRAGSLAGLTAAAFGQSLFAADVELLPGNSTDCVIGITMPTTVGNVANHKTGTAAPQITFGITVNATQQMYEEDSFGDDYDEDATFGTPVANAAELTAALEAGEEVSLTADIAVTDVIDVADGAVINLNGNNLDASANTSRPFNAAGDLTINAAGAEIVCGAYGLVNIPAGVAADVVINGGDISANTDNGSFVKPRGGAEQNIVLNNVNYTDASVKGYVVDASAAEDCDITINGGTFAAAYGIISGFDSNITVKNATFDIAVLAFEAGSSANLLIEDSEITVSGGAWNPSAPNACVAASKGGDAVVKNSTLTSDAHVLAVYSDSDDGTVQSTITVTGGSLTQTATTYDAYAIYTNAAGNCITVDGVIVA